MFYNNALDKAKDRLRSALISLEDLIDHNQEERKAIKAKLEATEVLLKKFTDKKVAEHGSQLSEVELSLEQVKKFVESQE
jgi:hypothetical protein